MPTKAELEEQLAEAEARAQAAEEGRGLDPAVAAMMKLMQKQHQQAQDQMQQQMQQQMQHQQDQMQQLQQERQQERQQMQQQQQALLDAITNLQPAQQVQRPNNPPQQPGQPPAQRPIARKMDAPHLASPEGMKMVDFRDWATRFRDFAAATRLQESDLQARRGVMRAALDQEWTKMWAQGVIPIEDNDDTEAIITALERYLRRHRHALIDRRDFIQRNQQENEKVDAYYAALRSIDEDCGFNHTCNQAQAHREERLRDRLIAGLRDNMLRQKVLETPLDNLTLDGVLETCRNFESSRQTDGELTKAGASGMNATSTYKKKQFKGRGQSKSEREKKAMSTNTKCGSCGTQHDKGQCPAKEVECFSCGRKGHYKGLCRNKGKSKAHQNRVYLHSIEKREQGDRIGIGVCHRGKTGQVKFLPDTGACRDAIPAQEMSRLHGKVELEKDPDVLLAAGGQILNSQGILAVELECNGRKHKTHLHVIKGLNDPLLSKKSCIALGLIPRGWPTSAMVGALSLKAPGKGGEQKVAKHAPESPATMESFIKEFPEVFREDGLLKAMEGPPMKVELVANAQAVRRYKPYSVPVHWQEKVKSQLDSMEKKGIIEDVPLNEVPEWTHPMVVVPKKGSEEPRITVDFTAINPYVKRPGHPTKIPADEVAQIGPGMGVFTTLDARHGYWQVKLDENSKPLTTFITPWGLKRFRRNPMGLISAGDEHNRRGDEALAGMSNVRKIVEDIVIYDKEPGKVHEERVREVIRRCGEAGITLGRKKCKYAQPTAEWCGYSLSKEGYTVTSSLVNALSEFPVPTSRTDVRSFLGMVQQFEAFTPEIAELSAPLRSLLSPKVQFLWTSHQQKSFEDLIQALTSPRILTHYRKGAKLRLETDAAQTRGLGFALWQQEPGESQEPDGRSVPVKSMTEGQWRLLQCGSRYITPTESRYSATEVELLAVVWAVKKCKLYLRGATFELIVDHKPLVAIVGGKSLADIETPRIVRLKEKLAYVNPMPVWRQGTKHTTVDVFSRFPVSKPSKEDQEGEEDLEEVVQGAVMNTLQTAVRHTKDMTLEKVKSEGERDAEYRSLVEVIAAGFPKEKHNLDSNLRPYWSVREGLSVHQGVVLYGNRVVVPQGMKKKVLQGLHAAHQGRERALQRARQCVYWPGITNDVSNMVSSCQECNKYKASQAKEPLMQDTEATYPGEAVAADLFQHAGKEYMVVTDRYSGWMEVYGYRQHPTSQLVEDDMLRWCRQLGVPRRLTTDGGPQFKSKHFAEFCAEWGIQHDPSSPHHHEANGCAEAAVKSAKSMVKKIRKQLASPEWAEALMEYRNTPRKDGVSPAQRLFGRPTRSKLPIGPAAFTTPIQKVIEEADRRAVSLRQKAKEQFDKRTKSLKKLEVGGIVLVQDPVTKLWDKVAVIQDIARRNRSYTLKTETGRILWRNRRFIKPYKVDTRSKEADEEEDGSSKGAAASTRPSSSPGTPAGGPRRSTRAKRSPDRLVL